jgi:hypothetical protein
MNLTIFTLRSTIRKMAALVYSMAPLAGDQTQDFVLLWRMTEMNFKRIIEPTTREAIKIICSGAQDPGSNPAKL